MIYSTYCFLETLIIMPFYNSWAQSSTDSIRKGCQSMDMYVGTPNIKPLTNGKMASSANGAQSVSAADGPAVDLGAPLQDRFSLISVDTNVTTDPIDCVVSAELMSNSQMGMPGKFTCLNLHDI